MLKGHLPRFMYHRVYYNIRRSSDGLRVSGDRSGGGGAHLLCPIPGGRGLRRDLPTGCGLGLRALRFPSG